MRERFFLFLVFMILTVLFFMIVRAFITVIIVSLISVIMLKPIYNFLMKKKWIKGNKGFASSLTLIGFFVVLIIPLFLIVRLTITQISGLLEQVVMPSYEDSVDRIEDILSELPFLEESDVDAIVEKVSNSQPVLHSVAKDLADYAISLGSTIFELIGQLIIFIILVASLLPVYDTLVEKIEKISPLGTGISELYARKITAMVKSLISGVFFIAIIQGVMMGVIYWIAGLPYVFLLTLISILFAVIPVVGISWIVIAIAILSVISGNVTQAIIVLVGFYGLVNWVDIWLRPKFLSKDASLNFALFMLGIFGGMAWAGFMGLFYGPVIMLLLVTTVEIYTERYAREDGKYIQSFANKRLNRDSKNN